jgi:hypothetical protein
MFRKIMLCLLLVVIGVGAFEAGASRFLLVGFAALAALGLLGAREGPRR